jgi:tetratricopeptide (TPR) repeat protein
MNSNKNKTEEEIYIEKGDALYKENLYKEAIAAYNNALKINPRNLMAQLKIAKAKLSDKNLKGSAATPDMEERPPVTLKAPEVEGTAPGTVRKFLNLATVFVRNVIYMTPAVIIISFVVWNFINAKESRIDSVLSKSTAEVNVKMSPEGANLIFGVKEKIEPYKAIEPAKPVTDQKQTKRERADVAKKENAKKVGPKEPATKERLVKKEKGTPNKSETENREEPGFWATLKEFFLSLFKDTGHKESADKGIIRDPLGAEEK